MKNVQLFLLVIFQFFALQMIGQNSQHLDNGRSEAVAKTPLKPIKDSVNTTATTDDLTAIDDADIPGTYYLQGNNTANIQPSNNVATTTAKERIEALEQTIQQLQLKFSTIIEENKLLKEEINKIKNE